MNSRFPLVSRHFALWLVLFTIAPLDSHAQDSAVQNSAAQNNALPAPIILPEQVTQNQADVIEPDQDPEDVPTLPPTVVPNTLPPAPTPRNTIPNTPTAPNAPLISPPAPTAPTATNPTPAAPRPPAASGSTPVIAPTTTPRAANTFGGTVRVIDRATIQNTPSALLTDVLRSSAGLDVVQTGPPGSVSSVFLRGANSQHTKVLLNGIPLNEPSGPSRGFDFSTLSLDAVERVEVLQGPQSPLYGSDAVGGVVNIVTRRGRDAPGAGLSVMGGSFGTHRESGYARGAGKHYDYALSGSWFDTDGFSATARRFGGRERDGLQLGTVDGRFGVWAAGVEVEYLFRWIDGRTELDDAPFSLGAPPTDDPLRVLRNQQFFQRVQATWAPDDGFIEHVAAFDLTDFDRDDFDDMFPFSTTGQSRRALYQLNVQLTDSNLFSAGGEYWAEDAGSVGFGSVSAASQFQRSAYLQDQWTIAERLYATGGVRWDDHSAAGSAFTYRVTLLADIAETGTRVRGSLGTGFRAPALAENLFPFGNPNLAPERSRGWEYGVDQQITERMSAEVVYFRNDLENLILFDLTSFVLENIGFAKSHGVEGIVRWQVTDTLSLDGSYTRTDTLDRDTGRPLVRRPRDKGAIAATWSPDEKTAIRFLGLAVGPRTDTRDATVVLKDYFFAQLSARRELVPGVRVIGRIDNLFDQQYEEATGFASAGISFFGGMQWSR